jgi:hypothetical protein
VQRIHVTIRPLNREDSVLYFPPESFGPFRVLHQIGAGTLGPVFRAYEAAGQGSDRLVAVKVFRLDLTPAQTTSLVDELNELIAAGITHPNIAAPIAAGLEHGAAYLAQEYAVGESLDVVLRERGVISVGETAELVESLANAIDYAASRGVHHGSLHLRDIVLAGDGMRVTGFGVAAALSKVGAKLPTRPQYSSPDSPSDIYSLGVIAFEAATGKRVSPDNLKDFEEEHGAGLREAFGVALASPEMRPDRAGDFAAVLREAADVTEPVEDVLPVPAEDLDLRIEAPTDLMGEPPTPFPAVWSAQPPRALQPDEAVLVEPPARRWPIVVVFLGFAVLAALSVGFFLRSPRPTAPPDSAAGVEETTVDLRANAPSSAPPAPAAPAPGVPAAPKPAPSTPPPAPSRPASGAVRRTQTGALLVRSTPADADVLVNGRARGKTPLALRDLALGSYTIRVARDGYATEDRTLQLTARRPTQSTTITLRTVNNSAEKSGPGGLNVQSRPAGARVFVNDRLAGSTPVAIPGLPAGPATVRIEMDGYQPWINTVSISAGDQTRVGASLERK